MAKDVLVSGHGKEIIEDGDRKKGQTTAEKIAGSGVVRSRDDACGRCPANRRELASPGSVLVASPGSVLAR